MVSTFARLIAPLMCLITALALLYSPILEPRFQAQLPYVLLSLAALTGLVANQARELAAALLALLCYWLVRSYLQTSLHTEPAGQIFTLLSLLLLPDASWRNATGLSAVLAAPVTTLLISGLFAVDDRWFASQASSLLANSYQPLKISALSVLLFAAATLIASGRLLARNNYADSSLLGIALLGFTTLGWFQLPQISAIMFCAMGALLLVNLVLGFLDISYRDELTQTANRRALHKAARELRQSYSLALVDIDHFKKINDAHGHDLGDQVLKVVAGKLNQVGAGGKVYRYGGEEFCLLFNGKNAHQIEEELEQLRLAIAEYDMVMRDRASRPKRQKQGLKKRGATRRKSNIRITVSMGLADSSVADGVFDRVMKAADNALYGAKRGGRNRVKVVA